MAEANTRSIMNKSARGMRLAVIAGRYNERIVERLLDACMDTLRERGVKKKDVRVVRVPGAFEMPLVARWLAEEKRYDAIVVLGAIIRGETSHFEHVARECSRGLSMVSLSHGLPVIFGVLTVDDAAQALARAGTGHGNKGREAALAAIEMIALRRELDA